MHLFSFVVRFPCLSRSSTESFGRDFLLLTGSQTTDRSRELIVSMSLLLCNGNDDDDDDDDDMISVKGRLSRMFLLLTGKR